MTQLMTFPDDANGDALRRLQRDGDPLTEPRDVDFTVVFPTETAAKEFAARFLAMEYRVSIEQTNCKPELPWDVLLVKHMIPTYAGICSFEDELERAAYDLGGKNDGWGCIAQNGK
jgi:hypothetical protein